MSASLAHGQQALLAALWAPAQGAAMQALQGVAVPLRAGAQAHLNRAVMAYRAHGRELAPRALGAAFPVLAQLLDEENFGALARAFWLAQPPASGDVAQWGAGLPEFVRHAPQLVDEPFLGDVAQVEWALHRLAFAPDATVDLASFDLLTTQEPTTLTLELSPGALCFTSPWPVVSIINAHLGGDPPLAEAARLLRERAGETALLWRDGLRPRLRHAAPGEAGFAAALQAGASLGDALTQSPALDFNAWLAPAVQSALVLGAKPHHSTTQRRTP
jgi:hypothetical protein